jgi:hypothetical protein
MGVHPPMGNGISAAEDGNSGQVCLPSGLGGPVGLQQWQRGVATSTNSGLLIPWCAGDQLHGDIGLHLHCPVRPMVEVERRSPHLLHWHESLALLS